MTTALLILLLGVLALTLGYWQSRTIRERLEDRGSISPAVSPRLPSTH
jgi:hypothetical protein